MCKEKRSWLKNGYQYCNFCKKETLHTPKLGLAMEGKRLCTVCCTSNYCETKNKLKDE